MEVSIKKLLLSWASSADATRRTRSPTPAALEMDGRMAPHREEFEIIMPADILPASFGMPLDGVH